MKRQAIVNAGIEFVFRNQNGKSFDTTSYNYVNGIVDHVAEVVGENGLSSIQHWETEVKTRDRDDKPEYKCKMDISVAFSNKVHPPNTTTTQAGLNTAALPIRRCGMPLFTRLTAT